MHGMYVLYMCCTKMECGHNSCTSRVFFRPSLLSVFLFHTHDDLDIVVKCKHPLPISCEANAVLVDERK